VRLCKALSRACFSLPAKQIRRFEIQRFGPAAACFIRLHPEAGAAGGRRGAFTPIRKHQKQEQIQRARNTHLRMLH